MTLRRLKIPALLAAATCVAAGCSSRDDSPSETPPVNTAPTISAITDQTVNQDTVVGPLTFSVSDAETDAAALTVVASTDAATLVPADGLVLGGSGGSRTITLTPFEAQTGMVTVALAARDAAGLITIRTFRVTVAARAASIREATVSTFAKGEADAPTEVNGFTFTQDADDPATFAGLIPAEEP
jgi:type IV pilus biogenesis protein CpaD/CtpE